MEWVAAENGDSRQPSSKSTDALSAPRRFAVSPDRLELHRVAMISVFPHWWCVI
jgi:hypothetical protein